MLGQHSDQQLVIMSRRRNHVDGVTLRVCELRVRPVLDQQVDDLERRRALRKERRPVTAPQQRNGMLKGCPHCPAGLLVTPAGI